MSPAPNPYLLEAKYALLQQVRIPGQFFGTPLGGVAAFGFLALLGRQVEPERLVRLAVLGVVNVGLMGVGLGVVSERAYGWIRLRQAAPTPPLAFFAGKLFLGGVMAALVVLGMFVAGPILAGVSLPLARWLSLSAVLVLGVLPFAALGLAVGYLARPNTAQVVVYTGALLLFPVFGFPLFPEWLQAWAQYLPSALLTQLALGVSGLSPFSAQALPWLAGYTVAGLGLAGWLFGRDEGKTFG